MALKVNLYRNNNSKSKTYGQVYGRAKNSKPIDLGKGRGHGLRWRTSAVISVADALHAEAQQRTATPHRQRVAHPLRGRSVEELCAEFSRGAAPVQ